MNKLFSILRAQQLVIAAGLIGGAGLTPAATCQLNLNLWSNGELQKNWNMDNPVVIRSVDHFRDGIYESTESSFVSATAAVDDFQSCVLTDAVYTISAPLLSFGGAPTAKQPLRLINAGFLDSHRQALPFYPVLRSGTVVISEEDLDTGTIRQYTIKIELQISKTED